MKIEFTEGDKMAIELAKLEDMPLMVNDEGLMSLNIYIRDPYKANNFLLQFFAGEGKKEFVEKCGFEIKSINLFMAKDTSGVMDKLEQCLDFLSSNKIYEGQEGGV